MQNSYTKGAFEYFSGLLESDAAEIWADLDLLGNETDPEKWKAKINNISRNFLLTPRFALMRILCNRAVPNLSKEDDLEKISYNITLDEDHITFSNISLEHAKTLSAEEHMNYIRHLMDIAGPSPDDDPDFHEDIIARIWHDEDSANAFMIHYLPQSVKDNPRKFKKAVEEIQKESKKRYSTRISREEAFQLGHILKFKLEEMEWFLMRVFHAEENGFRMHQSHDIIEAYSFRTNATNKHVKQLQQQYKAISSGLEKKDDNHRSNNWTVSTRNELWDKIEKWKFQPDTMDDQFLLWLKSKAPGLDLPSHTARLVYQNLAVYAYLRTTEDIPLPEEVDLLDELKNVCDFDTNTPEAVIHLYQNGQLSSQKCKQVAKELYKENRQLSVTKSIDNEKLWAIINPRKDKKLSSDYGAVNSKSRIQKLLMGEESVEKGDLLYLLWFTCILIWTDTSPKTAEEIAVKINDFRDAATALLSKALLPTFYPPHLLEQSILLSIIYAGHTGLDPAMIYAYILESVKEKRERERGSSKRHTKQDQLNIVRYYRNAEPKITLKQCAAMYGVSEQSISRWQKELIDAGLIDANDTAK